MLIRKSKIIVLLAKKKDFEDFVYSTASMDREVPMLEDHRKRLGIKGNGHVEASAALCIR